MNKIQLLISCFVIVYLAGCGPANVGDSANQNSETDTEISTNSEAPGEATNVEDIPKEHNCTVEGKVLEGNQLWLRDKGLLFCIVADQETQDKDYGDSHRILEIYNTKDCSRIGREILPVNFSPDFPYYLAEINYNNSNQMVAIKGFQSVYCYDLKQKRLLPELTPNYLEERFSEDGNSGMISHLEVWENYLVGHAVDNGAFVFDLSTGNSVKPVLPFAEFKVSENNFSSLFMLSSGSENVQAIIPAYDADADVFSINPLFKGPQKLSTNIPKSAKNNRFIILRQQGGNRTPTAIDMQARKTIQLPEKIAQSENKGILNWLKQQ